MEQRLNLLETVTLFSMRDQTDKDFLYVLACAVDTEEPYRSRLEAMMIPNSTIVWVTPEMTNYPCKNNALITGNAGTEMLRPYIEGDEHGMVWTTHIGTDDAISRDFVAKTKSAFDFDQFNSYHGFLYFPSGYACHTHTMEFYEVYDDDYFFLTLREPVDTFRSVLYTDHSRLHRRAPVAKAPGNAPMWIKVLHEHQIGRYKQWTKRWANRRRKELSGHGRVLKRFDIDISRVTCKS
jgi:hypothetical protein